MPLIAIAAADIDAAGRALEADLPVAWLDAAVTDTEAHATSPGHVSARISRSGGEVVVHGRAHAELEVACARCLDATKLDIDAEVSLLLKPVPSAERAGSKRGAGKTAKAAKAAKETSTGTDASGTERAGVSTSKSDAASGKGASGKRASRKDKDVPEYEFASDEADVDVYDGEIVVLDDFVREAILLEMPIFPLCSESCPGIRPASPEVVDGGDGGTAPPLDPRLAPLRALRAGLAGSASGPRGSGESTENLRAAPGHADAPPEKKTKKE